MASGSFRWLWSEQDDKEMFKILLSFMKLTTHSSVNKKGMYEARIKQRVGSLKLLSSRISQFLSPASAGSLQPISSSSDITVTPLCGSPLVFSSPASPRQVDPPALPPAADPVNPPQSVDLSDVTLSAPWTYKPSAAFSLYTPSTPSCSAFPPASP